jgi:hypothetical protein
MVTPQAVQQSQHPEGAQGGWVDQELDQSAFQDVRLGRRLRVLLSQMTQSPGQSFSAPVAQRQGALDSLRPPA